MRRGGSCPACGSNRCQFYCAVCINKATFDGDGQPSLQALRQQRDELLQRLHQQLADRAGAQQQQMRRWQLQQELTAAQAQAQRAKDALAKAQQQLRQLSAANSSRRHTLDALQQHTASARTEVLGHTLPTVLRYQALTLSHVSAMLAREQRSRLRELSEVFPLRINAVGERGPIQITICNVRLPEGGSTPPGGWPDATATNAALGNLLLFIDKVGLIMGGPLLHEAACMASTSSLWIPGSFWSRGPPSANAVLPLHVTPAGAGGGQGAGQAAYSSAPGGRYLWGLQRADSGGAAPGGTTAASIAAGTVAAAAGAAAAAAAAFASFATGADAAGGPAAPHPGLSSSGSGPHSGSSAALLSAAAAAAAAGGAATPPSSSSSTSAAAASPPPSGRSSSSSSSRREPDFKAAWDLLQRSLACFLKDKAARNGMQLPSAWNPLAWLVVYCAVVKRDSRQDGRLVAVASHRSIGDYAAAIGAAAAAGGEGGPAAAAGGPGSMAGSGALDCFGGLASAAAGDNGGGASTWPGHAAEDEEEEEEDEGWGVVKTILPPPPSQPDQVEHWARAMYADGNALAGNHGPAAAAAASSSSSNPASGSSPQQAGVYGLVGLPRGLAGVGGGGAAAGLGGGLGSSPGGAGGMLPVERIRSLFGK